jgi:hypothetical protein
MSTMSTNSPPRSGWLLGTAAGLAQERLAAPASRGSPGCRYRGAPDRQGTRQVTELRDLKQAAAAWRGRLS